MYSNLLKQLFGNVVKKGVPENFAKFTGKHLWQSPLFNKVGELILQLYY